MVDWEILDQHVSYTTSLKMMQDHVTLMIQNKAKSKIILLEHEQVYTTSQEENKSLIDGIPLINTDRGGGITYHGPGQRVVYPIIDLRHYKMDVHQYLDALEKWIIAAIGICGIHAQQNYRQRGVWLSEHSKIASVGIRVRKWIAFHGCAVNLNPDMQRFNAIHPCGIEPSLMTSFESLGKRISIAQFDQALQDTFPTYFCVN